MTKKTTQVPKKSSKSMQFGTTRKRNKKYSGNTLLKARATILTGYKIKAKFSEEKVHCSQVSNGNINRLDHEYFYQSNIKGLLHLKPDDCKTKLRRLNLTAI